MSKHLIRPSTINKGTKFLNEVNDLIKKGQTLSKKEINEIAKKHKAANDMFHWACMCSYLGRLPKRGVFISNLGTFTSIETLKCIQARNRHYNPEGENVNEKLMSKNIVKKAQQPALTAANTNALDKFNSNIRESFNKVACATPEKTNTEYKKEAIQRNLVGSPDGKMGQQNIDLKTVKPRTKKKTRIFSILWGLIKFNY